MFITIKPIFFNFCKYFCLPFNINCCKYFYLPFNIFVIYHLTIRSNNFTSEVLFKAVI
ncbi:hypothetical protein Hanom_Chr00s000007g01614961 [Helianthus anomalus]